MSIVVLISVLLAILGSISISFNQQSYQELLQEAVTTRNVELCEKVGGYDLGDHYVSKEEVQYFCIADYAVAIADVNFCRSLDEQIRFTFNSQKNYCLEKLAEKLHKPELCNELSSPDRYYEVMLKKRCGSSNK